MDSDKPDLNSILESARAQLEMYRRTSQEDLNETNKEILLARSKDQEMEDISGPLFDRARESSADVESSRATSGKSIDSRNRTVEYSKESKNSTETEEDSVNVEGEESSNKNFDSSTMTLGDQQSFQNQPELTSQTTYTNIHELTGPVKDDIILVTGPATDQTDVVTQASENEQSSSTESTAMAETSATAPDDVQKDQLQHNQMDGTITIIRGWKSEPCHRDSLQEITDAEGSREEDADKTDVEATAGAGTREGSPVANRMSMHEVAQKLSRLEIDTGKDLDCLNRSVSERDDVVDENADETSKDSTISVSDSDSVRNDCRFQGMSLFDNPPVPLNVNTLETSVDNRQMEFVEHYEESDVDNYDGNFRKSSDKSVFEDEGFVDSKDLMDSTKIIFISDQEDEQSSKPFETEDDNSCMLEPSSAGRSLDLKSDLEAKPSLTDVHQDQSRRLENDDDVVSDSERGLSLDLGRSNIDEQNVSEESNACQDDNTDTTSDVLESSEFVRESEATDSIHVSKEFDSSLDSQSEYSQSISLIQEEELTQAVTVIKEHNPTQSISVIQEEEQTQAVTVIKEHNPTQSISVIQEQNPMQSIPVIQEQELTHAIPVIQELKLTQSIPVIQEEKRSQSKPDPEGDTVLKKERENVKKCETKGHQGKSRDINTTKTPEKRKTSPAVAQVQSKDPNVSGDQNDKNKPSMCIGKLIFEALLKNMNKDNTQIPSNLAALLQSYSASKEAKNIREIAVISSNSSSGTDVDSERPDRKVAVGVTSDNDEDGSSTARSSPLSQHSNKSAQKKENPVASSSPRRSTNSPTNLVFRPSTPTSNACQRNASFDSSETDSDSDKPKSLISKASKNLKSATVAGKAIPGPKVVDEEIPQEAKILNATAVENARSCERPTTPKVSSTQPKITDEPASPSYHRSVSPVDSENHFSDNEIDQQNRTDADSAKIPASVLIDKTKDTQERNQSALDSLDESSESAVLHPGIAKSSEDNSKYSETSTDPSSVLSVERPLTPYVSDLIHPSPDIQQYIQEPPEVPNVRLPPAVGHGVRLQIQPEADHIDSGISSKTPPRPPPRMRQTPQTKKSNKLNFFKRLFGVRSKQSN